MKRRDIVRKLEAAGWKELREGKHPNFYNPNAVAPKLKLIQVPAHREIPEPLALKILRDAGLR